MNNCTDTNGGWALGCRIDGGQAEYVRALCRPGTEPYSRYGKRRAGALGRRCVATGFWAARISEITEEDTVLIIGAGPTGILYPALFHAEETPSHYCLRAVGRKNPFCPRALSGGAGHWAGKLQRLCEEA